MARKNNRNRRHVLSDDEQWDTFLNQGHCEDIVKALRASAPKAGQPAIQTATKTLRARLTGPAFSLPIELMLKDAPTDTDVARHLRSIQSTANKLGKLLLADGMVKSDPVAAAAYHQINDTGAPRDVSRALRGIESLEHLANSAADLREKKARAKGHRRRTGDSGWHRFAVEITRLWRDMTGRSPGLALNLKTGRPSSPFFNFAATIVRGLPKELRPVSDQALLAKLRAARLKVPNLRR